jgi:hypothetical protein
MLARTSCIHAHRSYHHQGNFTLAHKHGLKEPSPSDGLTVTASNGIASVGQEEWHCRHHVGRPLENREAESIRNLGSL